MSVPALHSLRGRPGLVGGGLAAGVLLVDRAVGVSEFDVAALLLVAGVVAAIWGDGDARMAGVALAVAGVATVVGARVLAALAWGVLPVVAMVVVLAVVAFASR